MSFSEIDTIYIIAIGLVVFVFLMTALWRWIFKNNIVNATHLKFVIVLFLFTACKSKVEREIAHHQKILDSLRAADMTDSMMKKISYDALFDTAGLYRAPIKVLNAKMIKKEYSDYKSIYLSFKNISGKKISGIRFRWYGLDAFNEPADMGFPMSEGFGGGTFDQGLGIGKTRSGAFDILSRDGKKVVLAWPYEVAFSDGTKWEIGE